MFNFCHNFHASDKCDSNDNNKQPPPPRPSHQAATVPHWALAPACGGTVNIQLVCGIRCGQERRHSPAAVFPARHNLRYWQPLLREPCHGQASRIAPFFHWISGSKPQLNQVYGNNQILIYPKVFNPYWWFLFALFVQKCKWALNKGKGGEVSYYRCHINTDFLISISDNNDTSVTFVNVLIVDWGKIFSEWNESCPEREDFEYFFC